MRLTATMRCETHLIGLQVRRYTSQEGIYRIDMHIDRDDRDDDPRKPSVAISQRARRNEALWISAVQMNKHRQMRENK